MIVQCERTQVFTEAAEEEGDALHAAIAEQIGQDARKNDAIFEGVPETGRNLRAIAKNAHTAVADTSKIDCVHMEETPTGSTNTVTRTEKGGMSENEFWWQ